MSFREIEVKLVVEETFDVDVFRRKVSELGPERTATVSVRDVYYLLSGVPGHVYRHRFDEELQQLTVKSVEADAFDRLEVNLDLGHHRGDQGAAVEAFLGTLGPRWRGEIGKEIEVFYFPDCEIVYYQARTVARAMERTVRCVEFEARGATDAEAGRAILEPYLERVGFDASVRERRSLLQLMYPELWNDDGVLCDVTS